MSDPTPPPAAPSGDGTLRCDCLSCAAKRVYGYAIGCCPYGLSHGAICSCGGGWTAAASPPSEAPPGTMPRPDVGTLHVVADALISQRSVRNVTEVARQLRYAARWISGQSEPAEPSADGRTHHAGCWETRGHHDCAIAEVRRLQSVIASHVSRHAPPRGPSL